MERLERASVIGALITSLENKGSWCGETHVQKAGYFLQEMGNVPLEYDYILYKHGPFSFELRDELTEMRANGLLELKMQPNPYGPSIAVTETGKLIAELFSEMAERYKNIIDFVASKLAVKGVVDLERLSTALYVTKEMESNTQEERANRIVELKPHINNETALESIIQVDRMLHEFGQFNSNALYS